jgi:hypothetical protein
LIPPHVERVDVAAARLSAEVFLATMPPRFGRLALIKGSA